MVDLAIAATFVRELTEEQFAEQRGNGRRRVAAEQRSGPRGTIEQRRNGSRGVVEQRRHTSRLAAATQSVNGSDPAPELGRSEPIPSRTRDETTRLRRALARFAQVRG
jgi:hypothetical protein